MIWFAWGRGPRALAWLLITGTLSLAVWVFLPAAQGFHVGYNPATDDQCLTRILDWCKPATTISEAAPNTPAQVTTPVQAAPTAPAVPAAASVQPARKCGRGFVLASDDSYCVDHRRLPCPAGYTGWQNSQLDECLENETP